MVIKINSRISKLQVMSFMKERANPRIEGGI